MDDAERGPSFLNDDGQRLAALLNHLFATRLSPTGRPYTLKEVSEATGGRLSAAYLSAFRKGKVAAPGADKVQALADFFGVDAVYFTGRDPVNPRSGTTAHSDEALRQAMAQPLVREVALRVGRLGEAEQALILRLIDDAQALGMSMRAAAPQRGGPQSGANAAPVQAEPDGPEAGGQVDDDERERR